MTDYNDGKWHGWNGGECPVHPESDVEGMYLRDGEPAPESPVTDIAAGFDWRLEHANTLIAFRVVKAYQEPRDWWIVGSNAFPSARMAKVAHPGTDPIHVREVQP